MEMSGKKDTKNKMKRISHGENAVWTNIDTMCQANAWDSVHQRGESFIQKEMWKCEAKVCVCYTMRLTFCRFWTENTKNHIYTHMNSMESRGIHH